MEPNRDVLKFYDTTVSAAWKKMASGYSHLDVEIEVESPKKKNPVVKAKVSYKGDFVGGKSYMLREGDTIASIAKEEYGSDAYANVLWEANADVLGKQCKVVPAGFGIEIPRIFVADWKKPPKIAPAASGVNAKAVKILHPTLSVPYEMKSSVTNHIDLGMFMLELTTEISGKLEMQKKGAIDASFDLRAYKLEASKNLGPIEGSYSFDAKTGKGTADITLTNKSIPGLGGTTKIALKEGGVKASFTSNKVSYTHNDFVIQGSVTVSLSGKLVPKPSAAAETQVSTVDWNVTAVLVVGTIAIVAILLIPESGGTSLVAGEAATTMALARLAVN